MTAAPCPVPARRRRARSVVEWGGIAQALVHVFRMADLHETVPPLLATLLVWEVALFDVLRGAYEGVPLGVRLVFLLGAPLTVTAAAMWELRRLRTRHGITLRAALLR